MVTFYLIRHGIKENIPFDPPLTEEGKKLAKTTAEGLKNVRFEAIIASHKLRAGQTAHEIAKHHNPPVLIDERLQERMEWEYGKTFEEFMSEWGKTDLDRTYIPEIGTSSVVKGEIMKTVIDELAHKHKRRNIAVVTHGGAIGDLLRKLFPNNEFRYLIGEDSKGPYIDISECSLTVIQKNRDDYILVKINDTAHLS